MADISACTPTDWLLAVMIVAIGALICGALQLRLRRRQARMRELHDSFLQSVQGLVIKLQHAMEEIPPGTRARTLMEQALDRADQVIAEGRDRAVDPEGK